MHLNAAQTPPGRRVRGKRISSRERGKKKTVSLLGKQSPRLCNPELHWLLTSGTRFNWQVTLAQPAKQSAARRRSLDLGSAGPQISCRRGRERLRAAAPGKLLFQRVAGPPSPTGRCCSVPDFGVKPSRQFTGGGPVEARACHVSSESSESSEASPPGSSLALDSLAYPRSGADGRFPVSLG